MKNKKYWEEFYKSNNVSLNPSDFAQYTLKNIKAMGLENRPMVDIACGNARDTVYFNNQGLNCVGIDSAHNMDYPFFEQKNLFDVDYSNYELYYLRFVVHALTEDEFERFIKIIYNQYKNFFIFIETRSTKGITTKEKVETFFKSSVGEEHFRMLYSKPYLDEKLSHYFSIVESMEDINLAIYGSDNPYCLRYILTNK